MPHKHTRKGEIDRSTINLPPTQIAQPLSTSKSAATNGIFTTELTTTRRNSKKRKRNNAEDDTPKAFSRLMAFAQGKKLPKALDDGVKPTKAEKKRKLAEEKAEVRGEDVPVKQEPKEKAVPEVPTIRPGEKMSEFSARVDAALPVSGLINKTAKNGKDPLGLKVGRTKIERRMHKMYDEWRAEEARRKDKREEAMELAEEEAMDEDGQVKWKVDIESSSSTKKKKKGKGKKKAIGEVDDGEDDPWAKVKKNRNEAKVRLHDVVKAPPIFSKIPRDKFKVKDGAFAEVGDVPKASGSLRRREELGEVRRSVVEGYRQMMKDRAAIAKESSD